jgi:hypothetical protein
MAMIRSRALLFGVPALFVATLAAAQTPVLGHERQINVFTTSNQARPAVSVDPAGGMVVVWQSAGEDGDGLGVFGRVYVANSDPLPEFQVNTYTTGNQYQASVAHDGSGNFVVVWASDTHTGEDNDGVFGQLYDSGGNAVGGEFHVNTYTTGVQFLPEVSMNPSGNFVVVWTSLGQDGDNYGVFGQRFDSTGTPQGGEFQVNTTTTGVQYRPDVAMTDLGTFVVVWSSGQSGTPNYNVFGQRFSSSGTPVGGEFQIDAATTGPSAQPVVATDNDGDFAVAWTQPDADGYGVFARRYDGSGNPEGAPVQVNTYTAGNQLRPSIAFDASHHFIVVWESIGQDDPSDPAAFGVYAQRFGDPSVPVGSEFAVNVFTTGNQVQPAVSMNANGNFAVAWASDGQDGSGYGIFARGGVFGAAQPMAVDVHAPGTGTQNLNGVLEPGETVEVEPGYTNPNSFDLGEVMGTASSFDGPAGATYTIDDNQADYGVVTAGSTGDCFTATGDCYAMTVSSPASRPAAHWDATFTEALLGSTKVWTLHVGDSFPDVPESQQFYRFIENLFHNGITGGCGGGEYCPDATVTRAQMAVFLLKSEHGPRFVPPACTGVFPDVPCPSTFADWIEQLAAEGITGGCGGGNYCPANPVTRQQMAVFLLKAKFGSAYAPPACTGVFGDVPCPSQFADWIEDLAGQGITGGCGGGNYCPTSPNTRGQMAVFLVKTFGLLLYGP